VKIKRLQTQNCTSQDRAQQDKTIPHYKDKRKQDKTRQGYTVRNQNRNKTDSRNFGWYEFYNNDALTLRQPAVISVGLLFPS
jgi:hypothetical protein